MEVETQISSSKKENIYKRKKIYIKEKKEKTGLVLLLCFMPKSSHEENNGYIDFGQT